MTPEPRTFTPDPDPRDDMLRAWVRAAESRRDVKTGRERAYVDLVLDGLIESTRLLLGDGSASEDRHRDQVAPSGEGGRA